MIAKYRLGKKRTCRRKRSSPNSVLYPRVCLKRLRKYTKKKVFTQDSKLPVSDLISEPKSVLSNVRVLAK